MVTRKEIELKSRQGGYRTLIENGKIGYVIDTCEVSNIVIDYDCNETMVFACDCDGRNVDYLDLDCSRGFTTDMMEVEHDKMVNKWIKKMEEQQ